MHRPIVLLILAGLIAAAGCNEREQFSRYPAVSVPQFAAADYVRDLFDPNPEVVYNAVCNLGAEAGELGKLLSDETADKTSAEYAVAREVRRRVLELLDHRDGQIVAASLRFLQLFGENYKAKTELIEPVSRVGSRQPQVQFEQITALNVLVADDTRLPEPLLRRWLDSPSWIVSRSAYPLIGRVGPEPLRQELVRRYHATTDEKEQLLLLTAFGQHPGPAEIKLIEQVALDATRPKLRQTALMALAESGGSDRVLAWVGEHYSALRPEDRTLLFTAMTDPDSEASVSLVCLFLESGHVPSDDWLRWLHGELEGKQEAEKTARLARIEQAVLAAPKLADAWRSRRDDFKRARARFEELQKEYAPLSAEFVQKVRALLTRYDVPEPKQQEFFKAITDLSGLDDTRN